jgi:hypothetical protein
LAVCPYRDEEEDDEKIMASGGITMKALSIIMPWPWLILNHGKDIENRKWRTYYRGRILIHTSKNVSENYYSGMYCKYLSKIELPSYKDIKKYCGCILGSVELVDCVQNHKSIWADPGNGMWHWVLKDPRPCKPIPVKGALGLWEYTGEITEMDKTGVFIPPCSPFFGLPHSYNAG